MRAFVFRFGPAIAAALALAGDGLSTFLHPGPSADHGFLDVLAILAGGWAIADCYARRIGPRMKPGQHIVSAEEVGGWIEAAARGHALADQDGGNLRSLHRRGA